MSSLQLTLLFLSALTVVFAIITLLQNNLFKAALSFTATIISIAALFVVLENDFIAVAQLMMYIGGILVIVFLGILLTNGFQSNQLNKPFTKLISVSLFIGVVFYFFLIELKKIKLNHFSNQTVLSETTKEIGRTFLNNHLIIFEIAALILTVALIGSFMTIKKHIKDTK